MKFFFLTLLLGATLASLAHAAQSQLPPSNPNSPQHHSVYLPSQDLGDTSRDSQNRWGAFAGSESDGASGVGLDKSDQETAEAAAMEQCRDSGGSNCVIFFVFLNQCAAVASTPHSNAWARGLTLRKVRRDAMEACSNAECEIVFEHCMK